MLVIIMAQLFLVVFRIGIANFYHLKIFQIFLEPSLWKKTKLLQIVKRAIRPHMNPPLGRVAKRVV